MDDEWASSTQLHFGLQTDQVEFPNAIPDQERQLRRHDKMVRSSKPVSIGETFVTLNLKVKFVDVCYFYASRSVKYFGQRRLNSTNLMILIPWLI